MRAFSIALLMTATLLGCSTAQQGGPGGGRGGGGPGGGGGGGGRAQGGGGPPQEAIAACSNKNEGDDCAFSGRRGDAEGSCVIEQRSNSLACLPADRQNGGRNQSANQSLRAGGGPDRDGGQNRPQMREHTITASTGLTASDLYPAIVDPIAPTQYGERIEGDWRIITANSIASHKTGEFPNPGNPSTIQEQSISVRVPANPQVTSTATRVKEPGYTLEGVKFDPGAGEFYRGKPALGWQYEALAGAVPLGLDENYAHVQPSGHYHYHGLPIGLMAKLNAVPGAHSPQVGWAVDGFPIYTLYGYRDPADISAPVITMTSSYRLKTGTRPSYGDNPGGVYDGTFGADYEYVEGLGTLDECNGRLTITPEYPNGTYAYFITETYPVVPRCVKGTPEQSARMGPPRG